MTTLSSASRFYARGFTLIEILIVIAVMSLVGIPAFAAYSNYNTAQTTNSAASNVTNTLQTAKSQALAQYIPTGCTSLLSYDFQITSTSAYSIHAMCLSGTTDTTTVSGILPPAVQFGGGNKVISFSALTGTTAGSSFTLTNGSGIILKTFTITTGGAIQVQ